MTKVRGSLDNMPPVKHLQSSHAWKLVLELLDCKYRGHEDIDGVGGGTARVGGGTAPLPVLKVKINKLITFKHKLADVSLFMSLSPPSLVHNELRGLLNELYCCTIRAIQ